MIPHSKPFIGELERQYVNETLLSPVITGGSYAKRFRDGMCGYLQSRHFFFTDSGSEGLYVALKALGIGQGDEVILPSYVCDSVYYAIKNAGATPVLVDIQEDWVASPEQIKSKISSRTKAIIVVYTFGLPCAIEEILALGVPVIEDICQAVGLEIKGKKAGSFGVASFISFAAIKCITTAGEGGGLLVNDDKLAAQVMELKKQGVFTDRITEAQAAFGLAQLEQYNQFLVKRKKIAEQYHALCSSLPSVTRTSYGSGMNYRFVIQTTKDVDETMRKFADKGVSLRRGVDSLLHLTFGAEGDFAATEKIFHSTLSFPLYPALKEEERNVIAGAIRELL